MLKLAGIDKKTPDPEGGKFGRDDKGELTGFVAENANAVLQRVARRANATPAQRQAGVKLISANMTAAGLTTVHDAMTTREDFIAYEDALAAGEMVLSRLRDGYARPVAEAARCRPARSGFGDERLRIGGVKRSATAPRPNEPCA